MNNQGRQKKNKERKKKNMEVKLITPPEYLGMMEKTAALAALTCHANTEKPYVASEVLGRIIKVGHESILEHITLMYNIKGLSRACLQELSRHRHISLSVESTRHTLKKNGKITAPFGGSKEIIDMSTAFLEIALSNPDMPNDELKYFLPEFWPTNLILTSNIRELRHIIKLRTNPAALNEFRMLAYSLFDAVPEEYRYLLKDCVYKETISYQEAITKIPAHAVFRHFKGNLYEVLAITKDTETEQPVVIYQDIEKHGIVWARPASMWFDEVADGVKRFERVDREESGHE